MRKGSISYKAVIPVLFSFFVMSFCDLVGIGVDNARNDFNVSNTLAQLIPMAVFIWFFALSLPIGILQERIGKRNMVNTGMLVTAAGLLLPYIYYSFPTLLAGFALLGIGNTILQVSANPLLIDVVPTQRSHSFLSFSQFVKAIGSMLAPFAAGFFAIQSGDWKLVLLVFGSLSILSALWLQLTTVEESRPVAGRATFKSAFQLMRNPYILLMVLGIFFVVGIDVGINATSGQFLMDKLGMDEAPAKQGRSLYFFGKMLGTFAGAMLLTRLNPGRFLAFSAFATLAMLLALMIATSSFAALALIFAVGLAAANIFPLIFAGTVARFPGRNNEISGLMIMAVSGGAFIPPVAGWVTDFSSVTGGLMVLAVCASFLVFLSVYELSKKKII
jgi:MFS transporter, FHS family, L-fucose permease